MFFHVDKVSENILFLKLAYSVCYKYALLGFEKENSIISIKRRSGFPQWRFVA